MAQLSHGQLVHPRALQGDKDSTRVWSTSRRGFTSHGGGAQSCLALRVEYRPERITRQQANGER